MKRVISLILLVCVITNAAFFITVSAENNETLLMPNSENLAMEHVGQLMTEMLSVLGDGKGEGGMFDYTAYEDVLPILYLEGETKGMSKENTVELTYHFVGTDGEVYVDDGVCTLKWQGASSLNYPKKNYTIKFEKKFEAKEGWGREKKYCLKANFMDHTHARNLGSARLWGQVVATREDSAITSRLNELPNGGAVDGFPVLLVINGEHQGLYTFNIPKDNWMFKMEEKDTMTEAIVGADAWSDATFFYAPATLEGDFEVEHNSYEDIWPDPSWIRLSLNRMIAACTENNSENLESIEKYLDLDSAIDYYIFSVLLGAFDCFGKNYLLVTFDGEKWFFSAYDLDTTYGISWDGQDFVAPDREDSGTMLKYAEKHALMNLILKYKKDELAERYWELRKTVLSEENVIKTISSVTKSVPTEIFIADALLWPTIPSTDKSNLKQIEEWYCKRVAFIDKQMMSIQ